MGSMELIFMRNIDVSSFLLFEGTADSEDTIYDQYHHETIIFKDNDIDDDNDAESCISQSPEFDDTTTGDYSTAVEDCPEEVGSSPLDQKWSGEDQEDEVVSGHRRRSRGGAAYNYHGNEDRKKLKACLDSGFSEMEKNRLFWEACLTS